SENTIFKTFSLGISTNRDAWVYDFDKENQKLKSQKIIENYNSEVDRYRRNNQKISLDNFLNNDPMFVKWSNTLKNHLKRQSYLQFSTEKIRTALYRPFSKK